MSKSNALLVLAGSMLLLSACHSGPADADDAITVRNTGAQTPSGPAPAETKGQDFVSSVIGGFDFAIASAKVVSGKAEDANARQFGQAMAAEFSALITEMKGIATTGHLKLDSLAGPTDQTDLALLSSTQGKPLEKVFAEQQLNRLSGLVGLLRAYKNGGDNAALQAWADKAQNIVNERLLAAQTLKAELEEADAQH